LLKRDYRDMPAATP